MSLDIAAVDAALQDTQFHGKLHHFPTIDSTQIRALADAQAGVASGQVYIADEQTAGRGRGGHTWHSEPDRGLYLTVLVRPDLQSNEVLKLSLATALAAQSALRDVTGYTIDLRWPNDLVAPTPGAQSRKLGGILTEAASSPDGTVRHAAIGIGINLNQAEFQEELAKTATSLRLAAEQPIHRQAIAVALLQRLDQELGAIQNDLFERFSTASSWVRDKRVQVSEDGGYTGTTAGLTEAGLLRVQCDDGTLRVVRHGGVREL